MNSLHMSTPDSSSGGLPFRVLLAAPPEAGDCMASSSWGRSPGIELAARAETESDAVRVFMKMRPDAVVLDWRLAVDEPARLIGVLRRMAADARIVAVVPGPDSMPALAAKALGAEAVVTLPDLARTLLAMAREAAGRGSGSVSAQAPQHPQADDHHGHA